MREQRTNRNRRQQPQMVELQPQGLHVTPGQVIATTGAVLTSFGIDVATHFNPAYTLAGLVGIYAVGKLTPEVLNILVPGSDPHAAMELVEQLANRYAPEDLEHQELPQDVLSKIKRILHIKTPPVKVRPKEERMYEENPAYANSRSKLATTEKSSQLQTDDPLDVSLPAKFLLDDVVEDIRELNEQGYIYFGEASDGPVAVHLYDLIHVLDISSSGKGKSNRQRLIMPQVAKMAETYYINPLCNKIKPVKDERQYEIWTPIYDLLTFPPVKEGKDIAELLEAIAEEIKIRNDQEEHEDFSWRDNPIVLFVDEQPEVYARCPQAAEYLDAIGRMGRQYNIIMYLCSQTAQVKDIGLSSPTQANMKTKIYGGGDQVSANRTMKGNVPAEKERVLQGEKGLTLMLADGLDGVPFVRAPLVTNTGLFEYLDLPSFNLNEWVSTSSRRSTSARASLAPVYERNKEATTRKDREESEDLLPFTPPVDLPESRQNDQENEGKRVKGKRVKGPHFDAILDAVEALEAEEKPLTLNAIAKKANLTRHQYDEIEETVTYCGYDLVFGQGRPKGER